MISDDQMREFTKVTADTFVQLQELMEVFSARLKENTTEIELLRTSNEHLEQMVAVMETELRVMRRNRLMDKD